MNFISSFINNAKVETLKISIIYDARMIKLNAGLDFYYLKLLKFPLRKKPNIKNITFDKSID